MILFDYVITYKIVKCHISLDYTLQLTLLLYRLYFSTFTL